MTLPVLLVHGIWDQGVRFDRMRAGLEKAGDSTYRATVNSGNPAIGSPGTGGRGSILSSTLEMSNVDLAAEFTNLIIAQRGYQANSRVITSSDELLQELVNLKR